MALLAGTNYDPSTAASKTISANAAMSALDTTNLRLSFTVPANGAVLVKIRVGMGGGSTRSQILLGILESTTVKARHVPLVGRGSGAANERVMAEAVFVVTGLTPSASLTWDAAVGVETAVASELLQWGGPDNTTANNAWGGASFEIWECDNLLAAVNYDPGTAVSKATTSTLAMTALDTTNLRASFTTPSSGAGSANVLVRLKAMVEGNAAAVGIILGVLDGSTVKGRGRGLNFNMTGTLATTSFQLNDVSFLVPVSASTSYNWDMAYGVELVQTTSNLKYGGPNDSTADNAFGAATIEVWKA